MATKAQLKKEIWSWFKDRQVIYLATMKGRKPQVRPVTMIHYRRKFWVTTGTRDNKVKQIKKNANIQYCFPVKRGKYTGSIRSDCRARIVKDTKTRHAVASVLPFFTQFWKTPDDPSYTLIELKIKQVEYMKPGKMISEILKL